MLRSILAVVAGFIVVPIVAFSCDFLFHALWPATFSPHIRISSAGALVVLVYSELANVIGGYVAGIIARRRPIFHAVILGLVGFVPAIPATIFTWQYGPAWYHVLGLLLIVPVCALGGWLAEKQLAPSPEPVTVQ